MDREKIIKRILDKNKYSNRKKEKEALDFCPCINNGKKCHNILEEELICFACYCPYYLNDEKNPEGGCEINNPLGKGKWYYDHNIFSKNNRVWDCSDCDYMHTEEGVTNFLNNLREEELYFFSESSLEELRNFFYKKKM